MRTDHIHQRMESFSFQLRHGVSELWQAALDFVYPPVCCLCGCEIPSMALERFCSTCQRDIAPFILDACQRCGASVGPYLDTTTGCIHCKTTPFHFDGLVRLGLYHDLLRRACLMIKKPGREPLADALAELLWSRETAGLEAANAERVLCVPKHWTSRLFAGHNPSETLARALAKRLHIPFDGRRIKKVRKTAKQSSLPRSRRLTNLRDAFRLRRPEAIKNRSLLLVDDVLTTGTTVNQICRLLRKAGAKTITVVVLARSVGDAR